ncbi:MAG: Gfo/Idh/MocA family oxidoreductase [Ignavibacteriales bacterium]|nr:Gfo/Idh/MocA family oxidoreductase [Ignavibacteriales bacterium]
MNTNRREFIKKVGLGTTAVAIGSTLLESCKSNAPSGTSKVIVTDAMHYDRIIGANDRVRVGVIGFSDRFKGTLSKAFLANSKNLNMEFIAVSDIWNERREQGSNYLTELQGIKVTAYRNNEDLYENSETDAVIISTADFQHAYHTTEAVNCGRDAYVEKPLAESMADNIMVVKAVRENKKIVQIGSQRRSGENYRAAEKYIKSGKFGAIKYAEMTWNVNQPDRWRHPDLVSKLKESDVDWKRFLINREQVPFDPRIYIEYRLFWPYSSGIPGQWMCHQIDTVHWFTGFNHPRTVVANGGIYMWNDGRKNADTMTAVMEYGPQDDEDPTKRFQVNYSSRFSNSAGGVKEIYFSNGGELNLDTNKVTPNGGLTAEHADRFPEFGLNENMLPEFVLAEESAKSVTDAYTGVDQMTVAHMRNWMECIRSRKEPNAPIEAGYNHSVASLMVTKSLHRGIKVKFDEKTQQIVNA